MLRPHAPKNGNPALGLRTALDPGGAELAPPMGQGYQSGRVVAPLSAARPKCRGQRSDLRRAVFAYISEDCVVDDRIAP
jgi:hypothetical protein